MGSRKAPRALAEAVPRLCLPVRGGEAPFRRDASHCALSRFLPTYTFQMLFVLPASHGLRPSDKLVLRTYVVAIMGMLTPHSLPAGARQLAPRPSAWRALFSATRGSLQLPDTGHTHRPPIWASADAVRCPESRPRGFFASLFLNFNLRGRLFQEAFPNPILQGRKLRLKEVS